MNINVNFEILNLMVMRKKPRLSFWQIWNMSFGFLGIQFGFALQNANVSRIFETLGANIDAIPILWIAAPITGLIIQPIIGHMSDRTWCRLGRRRPFFLIGAIIASIALIIMPNSPVLWVAAGMLWIMDASINISMEPFRAFVGDMLPSSQRTAGFAMQSFFIGTGAVIASLLPYMMTNWFGIENTAPMGEIPDSVKFSFYIGGIVFIAAVTWTVIRTKEYSPEELKEFEDNSENNDTTDEADVITPSGIRRTTILGVSFLLIGIISAVLFYFINIEKEVFILSGVLSLFGILEIISALMQKNNSTNGLTSILNDLNTMPKTMGQLAIVQFFSWFALFAMWIYTTAGVTSDKFDMGIDNDMISFLKTELAESNNIEEKNAITEELATYEQKLQNENTVSANVNLAKFFLNNEIFKEKDLVGIFSTSLEGYNAKDKQYKKATTRLKKLSENDNPDISYTTVNYIYGLSMEGKINLPLDNYKLEKYVRLKKIRDEYNTGANWVGVGFGVYNGFAAVFAFLLILLAKLTSRKVTHMISLVVGGASYLALFYINSTGYLLLLPFVGIGLAWASILAMPYAILTGSLPANKMGVYMGIFNFFIVIPQILAASILGFMVKSIFAGEAIYAMVLGGISLVIAALLVLIVKDDN